jgi:hypothetical protein
MNRYRISLISFSVLVQLSVGSLAEENHFQILNYDIYSNGKDVGDLTLKLSKDKAGHVIIEQSHIKASGWWWSLNITTVLSEEFKQGGILKRSDGKTLDEDTIVWTQISSDENRYQAEWASIGKTTDQEKKQFFKLSSAALTKDSNNTEEILLITKSMFIGREQQTEHASIPQHVFHTTWNNLPFFIQQNAKDSLPERLDILDTENLEIFQVSLNDLGYKYLLIGNKEIKVRHMKLSDGKFKPADLWVYDGKQVDESALPYIVRYTGEDEDGSFEVVLKP